MSRTPANEGLKKAAIFLMSLEVDSARSILKLMDSNEIKKLSQVMSSLGIIDSNFKHNIIDEVLTEMDNANNMIGNINSTERFLVEVLGEEAVKSILTDIKGPPGNTVWEKLCNIDPEKLFSYIHKENSQTIALIMSKLSSETSSKLISMFSDEVAVDVLIKVANLGDIPDDVLSVLERNIKYEFIDNIGNVDIDGGKKIVYEIFNSFNKANEARMMKLMEKQQKELATNIRENMFTFDDIIKFDDNGMQSLMKVVDKNLLPVALKGAEEKLRDKFLNNMSERAAKIIKEDMEASGPIKMSDVDKSQAGIVKAAKDLLDSGEVSLAGGETML